MQEEELAGGNVTKVAKVGDTVRRSTGPWTPAIHRLLTHVRAKGLLWVPEPLGLDEAGREILSFIPGTVPHDMPEWIWTEQAPGPRIWDLAYAAYRFVPLMPGPDADGAIPGGRSPFDLPGMRKRLESFLRRYEAGNGAVRFGCSDLIRAAIHRLHAIADWTEDFVRNNGAVTLADHPAMYRGHARWLGSLGL